MELAVRPKRRARGGDDDGDEIVSGLALARHLDCSRGYIDKLEAAGVFKRAAGGGGYDLATARTNYIRWLRRERAQSPKGEAENKFTAAKTALVEVRMQEKLGMLLPREAVEMALDDIAGAFTTALSTMPARIGGSDLKLRRLVEREVYEVRKLVSRLCGEALARKQDQWAREDAEATDADA